MARFSARFSLTEEELQPRSRPEKKRRTKCPRSSARYTHGKAKAKPTTSKTFPRAKLSLRSPLTFVYVGNLRSDVRNGDLERIFLPCGKIIKIEIRCCSGTAVPSCDNENTVYATILFVSVEGATQALFKDGRSLLGRRIVVAPSFQALPEANQVVRRRPILFYGVNLKRLSDDLQHAVNKIYTGGTQIFPEGGY